MRENCKSVYTIPCGFYEFPNKQHWMCEVCVFYGSPNEQNQMCDMLPKTGHIYCHYFLKSCISIPAVVVKCTNS